jgi:hypothetical protein
MTKTKSVRSQVHSAVWLIGIAVLALTDSWWPGILVLVAINTIVDVFIGETKKNTPQDPKMRTAPPIPVPAVMASEPTPERSIRTNRPRLPETCGNCGGPTRRAIRAFDGTFSCAFCDSELA